MKKIFLLLIIYFITISTAFSANTLSSQQDNQSRLTTLKNKISQLKQSLTNKKNQHKSLANELKKTELAINEQRQQQQQTKILLQQQQELLNKLEYQHRELQERYEQQRLQLVQQLHLAYLIDDPSMIRMLMNQQTLHEHHRTMTYLRYLHEQQQQQLEQLETTLQVLRENQQKLDNVIESIKTTHEQQKQQYQILQQQQLKREQLLTQLNHEINQHQTQISSLESNRKRLEKIIQNLQTQKAAQPTYSLGKLTGFGKLKGKLQRPTRGPIIEHFGSNLGSAQFSLKGILIGAPSGQNVYNIYPGKVVFADWLKGFGHLIIIDHGDGFMTLYGRNQSIFKKLGDSVQPNEVIAEVGKSGGHEKSGLYFEIRHNGHPLNPELWCIRA